jgi:hypothetical protein
VLIVLLPQWKEKVHEGSISYSGSSFGDSRKALFVDSFRILKVTLEPLWFLVWIKNENNAICKRSYPKQWSGTILERLWWAHSIISDSCLTIKSDEVDETIFKRSKTEKIFDIFWDFGVESKQNLFEVNYVVPILFIYLVDYNWGALATRRRRWWRPDCLFWAW